MEWHFRQAWAEEGSQRDTPVSPVRTSESGKFKKAKAHGKDGLPLQSFGGLMKSLATLSLNRIRVGENGPSSPAPPGPPRSRPGPLNLSPRPSDSVDITGYQKSPGAHMGPGIFSHQRMNLGHDRRTAQQCIYLGCTGAHSASSNPRPRVKD